jgi:hypothetical protein
MTFEIEKMIKRSVKLLGNIDENSIRIYQKHQ